MEPTMKIIERSDRPLTEREIHAEKERMIRAVEEFSALVKNRMLTALTARELGYTGRVCRTPEGKLLCELSADCVAMAMQSLHADEKKLVDIGARAVELHLRCLRRRGNSDTEGGQ